MVTAAEPRTQIAGGGAADTTSTSLLHRKQGRSTGGAKTVLPTVVTPTTLRAPLPLPTAAVTANQTTPDMVEVCLTLAPPALPILSHRGGNACNPDNFGQNKGSRHPSAPGGDTSNTSVTSSSKALGIPEAQAAMTRAAVTPLAKVMEDGKC